MPIYSELFVDLLCPKCGCEIKESDNKVSFQWGVIPNSYKIGDQIRWRKGIFNRRQWRIGNSTLTNLLVVDSDVNLTDWRCSSCGALLDKPCVEIQEGKIKGVWIFERGGFELKTGYKQETSNYFQICDLNKIIPLSDFELDA